MWHQCMQSSMNQPSITPVHTIEWEWLWVLLLLKAGNPGHGDVQCPEGQQNDANGEAHHTAEGVGLQVGTGAGQTTWGSELLG